MEYIEFIEYIRAAITTIFGDEKNVSVKKILKNNGVEYDALIIGEDKSNISPTIYLNSYYTEYENGRESGEIVNEIYNLYEKNCNEYIFDIDSFIDFEAIKDKIVFKVINKAKNIELLKDVPYLEKMDLALVPYCIVDSDFIGSATVLIHKSHLSIWRVTAEEIFEIALKNTPKILEAEIRNMNEIIKEMFISDLQRKQVNGEISFDFDVDKKADELLDELGTGNGIEMFVLTNVHKLNGASCMFYKDVIESFATEKKANIYILPSSIHEVILVPAVEGLSKNELSLMVQDVNREELSAEEVLSNHVYVYDYKNNELIM